MGFAGVVVVIMDNELTAASCEFLKYIPPLLLIPNVNQVIMAFIFPGLMLRKMRLKPVCPLSCVYSCILTTTLAL